MSTPNSKETSCNLLLVDDDPVFGQVLTRAMEKQHFRVCFAESSAVALEHAVKQSPDYAVVDLKIGEESGLKLIKALVELNPDMKIVMLTGYASVATAVEAIKLGATHYLTKPATVAEILSALKKDAGDASIPAQNQPMSVQRLEWEHLQKVLAEHDGNISAAARALNMHRRTLQRKLAKKPVRL